jgi:hypothetical protein
VKTYPLLTPKNTRGDSGGRANWRDGIAGDPSRKRKKGELAKKGPAPAGRAGHEVREVAPVHGDKRTRRRMRRPWLTRA